MCEYCQNPLGTYEPNEPFIETTIYQQQNDGFLAHNVDVLSGYTWWEMVQGLPKPNSGKYVATVYYCPWCGRELE